MENEVLYISPKAVLEQDKEFMAQIGNRLYKLRAQNNLTLTSLSESTGVSRKTIGLYENGSLYPNFGVLLKIINFYNISPFDFFNELDNDGLNIVSYEQTTNIEGV
jgi:transcriptional regulator with XRE-family HTH domain